MGFSSLPEILFKSDCNHVDWTVLKARLTEDDFDNQRTPEQYEMSFCNSASVIFAMDGEEIIGKARVLSDGVCNAYVVDIWTYTPYRKRGIAREMLTRLLAPLQGQHVYLFTDDAIPFYEKLGFKRQDIGLGKMVGQWLVNLPLD